MTEKKERKYLKWKLEELQKAIFDYRYNKMGLNECVRVHGIPKATLKRYLDKEEPIYDINISKGRPPVFEKQFEELIVEHAHTLENCMFGLTIKQIRKLAYQLAEKHAIPHDFNRTKEMAGKAWYYKFMERHKDRITLRQPEATSLNRAKGFNRENVNEFFDKYEKIVDEHNLDATKIYNVDESGYQTVQKKTQKVLCEKGKKQVGALTSAERGVNTTMVACGSAAGRYVPPMIIFKRMRMCEQLKDGAPPGSMVVVSESGYINSELFTQWLEHFIRTVKPTVACPVLLLLDGHTTHSKNLDALNLARDNGVKLLQLPGHTTHRLQPLDVSFFKPMSTYYLQAIETWLRTNPGQAVTQYQVSRLINEAYQRAATIGNIANGFKAAGIWPVNRHVFEDHHFAPSEILMAESDTPTTSNEKSPEGDIAPKVMASSNGQEKKDFQEAFTSGVKKDKSIASPDILRDKSISRLQLEVFKKSINELSPIPKSTLPKKGRGIQKGIELTSSPYKNELEASQLKRQQRDKNAAKKPKLDIIPKSTLPKKGRGIQKGIELTSSPYKNELEASQLKRQQRDKNAAKKPKLDILNSENNYCKDNVSKGKGIGKKTKTNETSSSDKETEVIKSKIARVSKKGKGTGKKSIKKEISSNNKSKIKQVRTEKKEKKRKKRKMSSSDETEDEETVIELDDDSESDFDNEEKENQCTMCKQNYYDKKGPSVDWVQCVRCHNWNHETCVQNPDICDDCFA